MTDKADRTDSIDYQLFRLHCIAGAETMERAADKARKRSDHALASKCEAMAARFRNLTVDADIKTLFDMGK